MPTDLDIIKELEKEIGIELTEEEEIDYDTIYNGAYQKDSKDNIAHQ